jgi:beta-glucanase (GH16 family)
MKTKYFTILILSCCIRSEAQTWNLVWSDEFNSGGVDISNWKYDIGGAGWGNNELEYYTNRSENARIDNGNLLIVAKKELYGGNSYTSARLKSQDLKSFTYGRIDARIKLPVGQGLWPAFWMLGNSISQVGWPKCGEYVERHLLLPFASRNIYGNKKTYFAQMTGLPAKGQRFGPQVGNCN